jgi:hypothetical protein
MSELVKRFLDESRRVVSLPESRLEIRIRRAKVYDFLRLRVPMGSTLQTLHGAAWAIMKGEKLSDELAVKLNTATPTLADLCDQLLMESIEEARDPGKDWVPLHVVPDGEVILDDDSVWVSDFTRGLSIDDLSTLQEAIWDLNGLSKGVELVLGPFRPVGRPGTTSSREELRDDPEGGPRVVPGRVHVQPSGPDGGGERGSGSGDTGGAEGAAEGGS